MKLTDYPIRHRTTVTRKSGISEYLGPYHKIPVPVAAATVAVIDAAYELADCSSTTRPPATGTLERLSKALAKYDEVTKK